MWYGANLRAAGKLIRRRPQFASVVALTLFHRLTHLVLRKHSRGWSPPPEQITVMVTDICNLRCKMCHYAFSDDPSYQLNRAGRIAPELFRKVIDESPGRPMVTFTGGEPLLHPQIAELVAYAKGKGRFCTLVTNGWMLADQAQALCAADLDILSVSVDGPPQVHDRIRGPRSFERLTRGVQAVLAQPRRPILFLTMAVTDMNDAYLVHMYDLARRWGVDGLNFNHLWLHTDDMVEAHNSHFADLFAADRVAWNILPSAVDAGRVAEQIETIRRRNSGGDFVVVESPDLNREQIAAWYEAPQQPVKYRTTRCAWTRLKVAPDGKVKPCRGWEAGNVDRDHAMAIWNGATFRQLRQTLAARGTLPICARCCAIAYR